MIVAYRPDDTAAVSLGEAVLRPLSCEITEEAGGDYALKLVHPITAEAEWTAIQPFALIRAPVPYNTTPAISQSESTVVHAGAEVWQATRDTGIYRTTSQAALWPAWVSGKHYSVGDKVSHSGRNYQCKTTHGGITTWTGSYWKEVSRSPVAFRDLPNGTQVYVTANNGTWLTVILMDGTTGFCKTAHFSYMYTITEDATISGDVPAREIREQLFRVMDVSIDSASMTLTANAKHISYDAAFTLVTGVVFADTQLVNAAAALRTACIPAGAASAPHLYCQNTGATVSGDCTRKTFANCILDPDAGLVAQCKAKLIRDNKDFFLLRNDPVDRGLSLTWGVNLLGVTWKRDFSKICTRVYPIAKDTAGNDYALPEAFVDSPLVNNYFTGMYKTIRVDAKIGEDGKTAEDVQAIMRQKAQAVFDEDHEDEPVATLDVNFILLGDTEEYKQYRQLERLNLYDTVDIVHPDIGLNSQAQVKGYTWDALACRYTRLKLGDVFDRNKHTVAGYDLSDGSISYRKFSNDVLAAIKNNLA